MADRGLLQDPETEPQGQDLYRGERECPSHPDLDSSYPPGGHLFAVPGGTANSPCRSTGYQVAAPPLKGWLVVLQYGPPAGGLRMNLFTYRDLNEWLNEPYATPPLIPEPEQLRLALR